MKNISFYSLNYVNELETFCILLIEKELDIFFSSCIRSALDYSHMISNNLALHEMKNFEEKVLSKRQIKELIKDILFKVNIEIAKCMGYSNPDVVHTESIGCNNDFINELINDFKVTQIICKVCEYIIDFAISRSLKGICKSDMVNDLIKRNISGKNILKKNNLINQKRKHQELLYKQIEGFLTNTKVTLRNELIKACIININNIQNISYEFSIA
ncbi:hypothetical protein I6U48_21600 [Clostridium sp. PL3]|uniref:Uncharacterized protein n=1 Tax=Clostridium thailandense TaxID=2794346 RepID=A0A949TUC4_9CLOT|nr:hypothetical protein [Clostridium thailandense]MBV7275502.1 hypothetical protein [Clostridium thailandense]